MTKRFLLEENGDPYLKNIWDVLEYEDRKDENGLPYESCFFRGDISPIQGLKNAIAQLRRDYPGCEIKVEREDE